MLVTSGYRRSASSSRNSIHFFRKWLPLWTIDGNVSRLKVIRMNRTYCSAHLFTVSESPITIDRYWDVVHRTVQSPLVSEESYLAVGIASYQTDDDGFFFAALKPIYAS